MRKGQCIATKLKYVSDNFKESHKHKRSKFNSSADSFFDYLGKCYSVPARFHKSLQRLKDYDNILSGSKTDIKILSEDLDKYFIKEYESEIKNYLWVEFLPLILKSCPSD